MRITSTTRMPVIANESTAAGPAALTTTPATDEKTRADHATERDHLHVTTLQSAAQPARRFHQWCKLPSVVMRSAVGKAERTPRCKERRMVPSTKM